MNCFSWSNRRLSQGWDNLPRLSCSYRPGLNIWMALLLLLNQMFRAHLDKLGSSTCCSCSGTRRYQIACKTEYFPCSPLLLRSLARRVYKCCAVWRDAASLPLRSFHPRARFEWQLTAKRPTAGLLWDCEQPAPSRWTLQSSSSLSLFTPARSCRRYKARMIHRDSGIQVSSWLP